MKVTIEYTEEDVHAAMKNYVAVNLPNVFKRPVFKFSTLYGEAKCTVTEDDTPVEPPPVPANPVPAVDEASGIPY